MTLVAPRNETDYAHATHIDVVVPGSFVEISGRLDALSVRDIRSALDDALPAGSGDLVVDIRTAELHDSAGLGVFVGVHRRAHLAGRRLIVLNPSERFARVARASRYSRILHLAR